jgi:hypothetical protein
MNTDTSAWICETNAVWQAFCDMPKDGNKLNMSDILKFGQACVIAERERCAALVKRNADACSPGSMLQVYLASNAVAIRQDPDAIQSAPQPAPMPASALTTPQG